MFSPPRPFKAGITPAHAGKRSSRKPLSTPPRDHPRTRGEKFFALIGKCANVGSPPHTRGKGAGGAASQGRRGITPAHAGKRKNAVSWTRTKWDHPRTRGEKKIAPLFSRSTGGSPPHTRGKDPVQGGGHHPAGITPAHAGKSRCWWLHSSLRWDHPRTRGEKAPVKDCRKLSRGSPPHTRGKAGVGGCTPVAGGITPAHAGKRNSVAVSGLQSRDHPRTRGEKRHS